MDVLRAVMILVIVVIAAFDDATNLTNAYGYSVHLSARSLSY